MVHAKQFKFLLLYCTHISCNAYEKIRKELTGFFTNFSVLFKDVLRLRMTYLGNLFTVTPTTTLKWP